mgnify:FL=1
MRAAFRKWQAKYCGYTNDAMLGMWSGLTSIFGVKIRAEALKNMNTLSRYGYIRYTLDEKTNKLEYAVADWGVKYSGAECMSGTVSLQAAMAFSVFPATSRSEKLTGNNTLFCCQKTGGNESMKRKTLKNAISAFLYLLIRSYSSARPYSPPQQQTPTK